MQVMALWPRSHGFPWFTYDELDQNGIAKHRARVLYKVTWGIRRKPLGSLQNMFILHI
jgi:hypothetical protein